IATITRSGSLCSSARDCSFEKLHSEDFELRLISRVFTSVWRCKMRAFALSAGLLFLLFCPTDAKHLASAKQNVVAKNLTPDAINNAEWDAPFAANKAISPVVIKAEILLARAHFSPGEISGRQGENLGKAIAAFAEAQGMATSKLDHELWDKLVSMSDD